MSYDGRINFGLIGDYEAMRISNACRRPEGVDRGARRGAGGRAGFLRRFVPGADREAAATRVNGSGEEHSAEAPGEPGTEG